MSKRGKKLLRKHPRRHNCSNPPLPPGWVVVKTSGKLFKHGGTISTIKGYIEHPHLPGVVAYTFEEDDSYVAIHYCLRATEEEIIEAERCGLGALPPPGTCIHGVPPDKPCEDCV